MNHAKNGTALGTAAGAGDPQRDAHRGGNSYDASMLRELLCVIHRDGGHYVEKHGIEKAVADAAGLVLAAVNHPIDMVLHCPLCKLQHVDSEEDHTDECGLFHFASRECDCHRWDNPPHRTHKCHGCGTLWRPADVPTNGVQAITTRGKADTWPPLRK